MPGSDVIMVIEYDILKPTRFTFVLPTRICMIRLVDCFDCTFVKCKFWGSLVLLLSGTTSVTIDMKCLSLIH